MINQNENKKGSVRNSISNLFLLEFLLMLKNNKCFNQKIIKFK